jgi:hypothetical protein
MKHRFDMNLAITTQLAASGLRIDANETAVFLRELEFIQTELVEQVYPEYKGLTLVPISGGAILPGVRTVTYREIERFGEAELLENLADEDFPTADVVGREVSTPVRSVGSKYLTTIEDLRAAASMQISVDTEKGKMARRAIEGKLDRLVMSGGGPFNGLLTNASSQDDTAGATTAGTASWSTLDFTVAGNSAKIVASLRYLADSAFKASKGAFEAFDFVMSTNAIATLGARMDPQYSDKTIQDFILSSVPRIRSITHSARCNGAGASGVDRILAYPRDPQVIDCVLPIRFEQFAPQLSGMTFKTFCHAKYGGLRIKHPNMIRRFDVTA